VVNRRPTVLVWRAGADDPPPGIAAAEVVADVRYAPDTVALAERIGEADALFFYRGAKEPLEAVFAAAERLRWIQSASDGVDGLLFPALIESEVVVTNARGVFEDAIAEWVVGAMLAFSVRILDQRDHQRQGSWVPRGTERLAGSRLLVVGPGPIGRAVARRASALGMRVEAVGRTARDDDLFSRIRGIDELHDALADADHVLDSLPLTATTHHSFDSDAFAAMRPSARFYNVGRGPTVDEPALIEALRAGRIAGAALDVFETEPLPADSPLWTMADVLVSPHMCGDFEGWERAVVEVFVDNLERFARGAPMRNVVDKALGFGVGEMATS
jgi:phosphoglycerate dehydrogenase-like enzyme